jgi:hypothetical protein
MTPPSPSEGPHVYRRLVTHIKRSSAGVNTSNSSVMWSASPAIVPQITHNTTEEALIILDNLISSTVGSATEGVPQLIGVRHPPQPPAPISRVTTCCFPRSLIVCSYTRCVCFHLGFIYCVITFIS